MQLIPFTMYAHSYPYEYTHINPTHVSIFEDWAGKFLRLKKSLRRLAVDKNVTYHLIHNPVKSQVCLVFFKWASLFSYVYVYAGPAKTTTLINLGRLD